MLTEQACCCVKHPERDRPGLSEEGVLIDADVLAELVGRRKTVYPGNPNHLTLGGYRGQERCRGEGIGGGKVEGLGVRGVDKERHGPERFHPFRREGKSWHHLPLWYFPL